MSRGALIAFVSLLSCALACSSCARQAQTASRHISQPAVAVVMQHHVQNAMDAGDGDLELRLLRQRLAENANDLDARILLARRYAQRGVSELALEHYRFAADRFPDSIVVALELAKTFRSLGRPRQALDSVKLWLNQHPEGSWELFSFEGILEDESGQLRDAETSHRSALSLQQGRSALHNNLGYNLMLQGRAAEAVREFRRALELDPSSSIAHNNLGAALVSQTDSDAALAEWRRSADAAVGHNNLAATLIEQGRYAEARAELEAALKLRRNFPAALANLRLVAASDGKPVTVQPVAPFNGGKRSLSQSKSKPARNVASIQENISGNAPAASTELARNAASAGGK